MKLQTKICIFFLPLGIASVGLLVHISMNSTRRIIEEQSVERGITTAAHIADEMREEFRNGKEGELLPFLQSAQKTAGAVYAMALDRQGRVLAQTRGIERDKMLENSLTREALGSRVPHATKLHQNGKELIEVAIPVWDSTREDSLERIGAIRLAIPLDEGLNIVRKISNQFIMAGLIIGGFFCVAAWMFTRNILAPVRLLVDATDRISHREYVSELPLHSSDELGDLARSVNRMNRDLADTTVSKMFMNSILKSMLDSLIVTDGEGKIKMANRALLDLVGYKEEEILGKPIDTLFDQGDPLLKVLHGSSTKPASAIRNAESFFIPKSGDKVPILFSGSLWSDDQSKGWIVVAKDMRDRKKLEIQMLQSSKLMAVGQLASGVAHEINNPLGVILGFAEGAVRRLKPGDALELPLKSIEREAIRCKNLVQDLLTFSRVSQAERQPVDLNYAVEGALSLIRGQARIGQIKIEKNLAEGLPYILGNPNQIQQVIINIATNALDAMEQHGNLTIKTELCQDESGSWITLIISDTGPGIPPEVVTRIFDPFFTTKPVGKGTGLGLALVHEIVTKHSGLVDVKSHSGHTEFFVKFPHRMGRSGDTPVTKAA